MPKKKRKKKEEVGVKEAKRVMSHHHQVISRASPGDLHLRFLVCDAGVWIICGTTLDSDRFSDRPLYRRKVLEYNACSDLRWEFHLRHTDADILVAELATALGYEVHGLEEYSISGNTRISVLRNDANGFILSIREWPTGSGHRKTFVAIDMSRATARKYLKALAGPLGWELEEDSRR